MGRLILIAIVVFFVVWMVRRALSAPPADGQSRASESHGDLVACAHCGVNLPRSEARSEAGRHYCSEEHRRLGPRER